MTRNNRHWICWCDHGGQGGGGHCCRCRRKDCRWCMVCPLSTPIRQPYCPLCRNEQSTNATTLPVSTTAATTTRTVRIPKTPGAEDGKEDYANMETHLGEKRTIPVMVEWRHHHHL